MPAKSTRKTKLTAPDASMPASLELANRGIETLDDAGKVSHAVMMDLLNGSISHKTGNSINKEVERALGRIGRELRSRKR